MLVIIIIILSMVCLLFICLFFRVRCNVRIVFNQELNITCKVTFFGIPVMSGNVHWDRDFDELMQDEDLLKRVRTLFEHDTKSRSLKSLKKQSTVAQLMPQIKKIKLEYMQWHSTVGMDHAAYAGLFSGFLWTVKGVLIGILDHLVDIRSNPNLDISTVFDLTEFETECECIFSLRLGQAIYTLNKVNKITRVLGHS